MVRKLRFTKRALGRLDEIAAYIAKDNPTRAQSFVEELRQKLEVLQTHHLGTPGRVYGTKEMVLHPNYIAVYRVKEDEVQILTVLHSARLR